MTHDEDYWWMRAACRGKYDLFDAEESISGKQHYPHLTEAREICDTCPVFDLCKRAGLMEITGIWAGEGKGM